MSKRALWDTSSCSGPSLPQSRKDSCFVNSSGSAINTVHFLALSLLHLLCHSALCRVVSVFLMLWSSASDGFSSSVAILNCLDRVQSSCHSWWVLSALWFIVQLGLVVFPSSTPNLSAAKLTTMDVTVSSHLSASLFNVVSMILAESLMN